MSDVLVRIKRAVLAGVLQEGDLASAATMFTIKICPSCGSNRIARVRRDWTDEFGGSRYTVPDLEYYECPACGERVYDRDAMRKIEACSPAFRARLDRARS